ncbi:hypothetical protein BCR34DRAFT_115910 [Clohesyomyces aquaticus]|uniref:Uncharacterized protein n=1 Tax=Clohesyomyces aquaticus TaxID=1231657 RepID=A0A1Y1YQ38_9PLEO|nr:hypothetical protein BCR34DRAFT_115910 [Clohesyomyces aquaticus]
MNKNEKKTRIHFDLVTPASQPVSHDRLIPQPVQSHPFHPSIPPQPEPTQHRQSHPACMPYPTSNAIADQTGDRSKCRFYINYASPASLRTIT